MAVSSSSGSVHVFRLGSSRSSAQQVASSGASVSDTNSLEGTEEDATPTAVTKTSSIRRRSMQMVGKSLTGYLPSAVTEMWEPQRDFAWFKLPVRRLGFPINVVAF